jgi:ABC-type transport system substrate-binding protein
MRRIVASLITIFMVLLPIANQNQICISLIHSDLRTGPHIDSVDFRYYSNLDQLVSYLESGNLEIVIHDLYEIQLPDLEADPNIAISSIMRNGYGHLTINCAKYPLNISGLRRAFAYAFNKSAPLSELSNLPEFMFIHDSLVAPANPFCIEEALPFHYYDAEPDKGNEILDELGFSIDNLTGFRSTPNGSQFQIKIEYPASQAVNPIPRIAVQAFNSLYVNATYAMADYTDMNERLANHGDFDITFYASIFQNDDIQWLTDEYWSSNANVTGKNPCNFRNDTYDSWRYQLLYGKTYDEVYEAAAEMQKILQYNVPRLVVYSNYLKQAYRVDKFSGYIEDMIMGVSGVWTLRNLHQINGSTEGGSVNIGIHDLPPSFNFLTSEGMDSNIIIRSLYSSLFDRGPDFQPINDLAQSIMIETHSDNSEVPEGSTRFTIDIIQNATWSDGVPLTAEDVAFTFNFLLEMSDWIDSEKIYPYDDEPKILNLTGFDNSYLTYAYAPMQFRFVIEYSSESYWLFSDFAYIPIIPMHIFVDFDLVDLENWNPIYNTSHPLVTCGPFTLSEYIPENHILLSYNPLFHYGITRSNQTTSTELITGITAGDLLMFGVLTASLTIVTILVYRIKYGK